jgi:hypothetical protein
MSTYNDASLIYYPSGFKAGKAYSLKPTDGSGDLTFTRASTATRVNESGLIEDVATGVPRIDFTGGGCGSLILEPQATNLATDSEPTNTGAFKTGVVFQTTSIYGWNGMYYGDNSVRRVAFFSATTVVGVKYCFSFFVKMTDGSIPSVGATSSNDFQIYISSVTSENLTITEIGGGVYRVSITRTATSPSSTLAVEKTTSMSAKTFEISGLQLEVSNVLPSSYIPTSGTAVTRVKDSASKSGISSLINSAEGVLYFEIKPPISSDPKQIKLTSSSVATNYLGFALAGTSLRVLVRPSSGSVLDQTITIDGVSTYKIAILWKDNDRCIVSVNGINGTSVSVASTMFNANSLEMLSFGDYLINNNFYGNVQNLMVFPTALSDAELIALTTI